MVALREVLNRNHQPGEESSQFQFTKNPSTESSHARSSTKRRTLQELYHQIVKRNGAEQVRPTAQTVNKISPIKEHLHTIADDVRPWAQAYLTDGHLLTYKGAEIISKTGNHGLATTLMAAHAAATLVHTAHEGASQAREAIMEAETNLRQGNRSVPPSGEPPHSPKTTLKEKLMSVAAKLLPPSREALIATAEEQLHNSLADPQQQLARNNRLVSNKATFEQQYEMYKETQLRLQNHLYRNEGELQALRNQQARLAFVQHMLGQQTKDTIDAQLNLHIKERTGEDEKKKKRFIRNHALRKVVSSARTLIGMGLATTSVVQFADIAHAAIHTPHPADNHTGDAHHFGEIAPPHETPPKQETLANFIKENGVTPEHITYADHPATLYISKVPNGLDISKAGGDGNYIGIQIPGDRHELLIRLDTPDRALDLHQGDMSTVTVTDAQGHNHQLTEDALYKLLEERNKQAPAGLPGSQTRLESFAGNISLVDYNHDHITQYAQVNGAGKLGDASHIFIGQPEQPHDHHPLRPSTTPCPSPTHIPQKSHPEPGHQKHAPFAINWEVVARYVTIGGFFATLARGVMKRKEIAEDIKNITSNIPHRQEIENRLIAFKDNAANRIQHLQMQTIPLAIPPEVKQKAADVYTRIRTTILPRTEEWIQKSAAHAGELSKRAFATAAREIPPRTQKAVQTLQKIGGEVRQKLATLISRKDPDNPPPTNGLPYSGAVNPDKNSFRKKIEHLLKAGKNLLSSIERFVHTKKSRPIEKQPTPNGSVPPPWDSRISRRKVLRTGIGIGLLVLGLGGAMYGQTVLEKDPPDQRRKKPDAKKATDDPLPLHHQPAKPSSSIVNELPVIGGGLVGVLGAIEALRKGKDVKKLWTSIRRIKKTEGQNGPSGREDEFPINLVEFSKKLEKRKSLSPEEREMLIGILRAHYEKGLDAQPPVEFYNRLVALGFLKEASNLREYSKKLITSLPPSDSTRVEPTKVVKAKNTQEKEKQIRNDAIREFIKIRDAVKNLPDTLSFAEALPLIQTLDNIYIALDQHYANDPRTNTTLLGTVGLMRRLIASTPGITFEDNGHIMIMTAALPVRYQHGYNILENQILRKQQELQKSGVDIDNYFSDRDYRRFHHLQNTLLKQAMEELVHGTTGNEKNDGTSNHSNGQASSHDVQGKISEQNGTSSPEDAHVVFGSDQEHPESNGPTAHTIFTQFTHGQQSGDSPRSTQNMTQLPNNAAVASDVVPGKPEREISHTPSIEIHSFEDFKEHVSKQDNGRQVYTFSPDETLTLDAFQLAREALDKGRKIEIRFIKNREYYPPGNFFTDSTFRVIFRKQGDSIIANIREGGLDGQHRLGSEFSSEKDTIAINNNKRSAYYEKGSFKNTVSYPYIYLLFKEDNSDQNLKEDQGKNAWFRYVPENLQIIVW